MNRALVLVSSVFLAAGIAFPADTPIDDMVFFSMPSRAGNAALESGIYKVKVQGMAVYFTDTKTNKTYTTLARVEKLDKPAQMTSAVGTPVDGVNRVTSIVFRGADVRITFSK